MNQSSESTPNRPTCWRTRLFPVLGLLTLLWPLSAPASEWLPQRLEAVDLSRSALTVPNGLTATEWHDIRQQIAASVYTATPSADGGYRAANPAHGLSIRYSPDGTTHLTPRTAAAWEFGLTVSRIGSEPLNRPAQLRSQDHTLTYHWHDSLREWWVNRADGLEQWLELGQRPADLAAEQPLTVQMTVSGNLHGSAAGTAIAFADASGTTLFTYDKLQVWDATGRVLPAQMSINDQTLALVIDDAQAVYPLTIDPTIVAQQAYLKASNTEAGDSFSSSVAISGDTVVVGAYGEYSNATGINGDQTDNSNDFAGAVYVFVRSGTTWSQQAYLKASNTDLGDSFGIAVAIDGDTIVVGAYGESSSSTGVNGNQSNDSFPFSGAAYVFVRSSGVWSQQAYLKASNTGTTDVFGSSVAVSGDTVVVGAPGEAGSANSLTNAGAAYVFTRSGTAWSQQALLRAANTNAEDSFGSTVALSSDTIVVGAYGEDGSATTINGSDDNSATDAGAAYVFVRTGSVWSQEAYLKAANTEAGDAFGYAVKVSGDTAVVGAYAEDSSAITVGGNANDNSATDAGAAYVFVRNSGVWSQQSYLKASNTEAGDSFGRAVAIDGDTVVVGAISEASSSTGVDGVQTDNSLTSAGAAYVFSRSGSTWSQQNYLKASDTDANDFFGVPVAVDGDTIVVGANGEASDATGVDGDDSNNNAPSAGAAYVFVASTGTATTTAITSDSPDPSVIGEAVTVSFTVTPADSGTPTGTVTVTASSGETCMATVAAGSCMVTFTSAGAKTLTASYAGDGTYAASSSSAVNHTVNTISTTTSITSDNPDPSFVGQNVTIAFTVTASSGTATGTVTVTADSGESCVGNLASGAGSCTMALTTAGARMLTASYAGNSTYAASSSSAASHTVNTISTTTSITSDSPDPSVVGENVTVSFTVTSSSGTPTGTVTVTADSGESCMATVATGSCTLAFTATGAKMLTASYAGNSTYAASSSSAVSHTVNLASTTTNITSDTPDPSEVGENVTVSFTVTSSSGTPTGTVTVTADSGESCMATVATGSCTLAFTTTGAKMLTASYPGNSTYAASSSSAVSHTVNLASTTTNITSDSPDPSVVGENVTVSFTVTASSGTPTGTVTVTADSGESCMATVATGSCTLAFTTTGAKMLTASYAGDSTYATSTSTDVEHTVKQATTTAITGDTPDPSTVGQQITVNFTVTADSGTPTGNVTVSANSGENCTATVAVGSCTLTFNTTGTKMLTANYAGDSNYAVSTSTAVEHTVKKASTTAITSDAPDPSIIGEMVTVSFTVSVTDGGTPTGNVMISADSGENCTATVAEGSCTLAFNATGTKMLTASYAGDSTYIASSSASVEHTVKQATITTITSDNPDPSLVGQQITVSFTVSADNNNAPTVNATASTTGGDTPTSDVPTAAITPAVSITPTGNVTVNGSGGETCTATVAAGSCTLTFTSSGAKTLTATYEGDSTYVGSTSASVAHTVNKATTTTTVTGDNPDPSLVGQQVTVSFTVTTSSGTASGNVTVNASSGESCTATVAAGSCTVTFSSSGAKTLTATYAGSTSHASSTSASVAHTVNKATTTTTITGDTPDPSLVGQQVTVSFTVTTSSGTASGNVTVNASSGESCTATVAAGSCTVTFSSSGAKTLTASYAGSTSHASSTSASTGHTVNKATTTTAITSDTPDPSVTGQEVTVSFTVTASSGTPSGNVTVSANSGESCTATVAAGSCKLTFNATGAKTLTASYAGSSTHASSTSASTAHTVNTPPVLIFQDDFEN